MDEQTRSRLWGSIGNNYFMEHNFMHMESLEQDRAVFVLEVHQQSKNPYNIVHGGAMYALADNAAGLAVHTDGRTHVTQDGQLHFLANQSEGTIRAVGTVRRRGRLTTLAEVDILGEDDRLLATGQFTYFCLSELQEKDA